MSLNLTFKAKTPFRDIGDGPYCLWLYQITLEEPASGGIVNRVEALLSHLGLGGSPASGGSGKSGGSTTSESKAQVGLGFSSKLDIKDPSLFPEVPELQGTRSLSE